MKIIRRELPDERVSRAQLQIWFCADGDVYGWLTRDRERGTWRYRIFVDVSDWRGHLSRVGSGSYPKWLSETIALATIERDVKALRARMLASDRKFVPHPMPEHLSTPHTPTP